MLRVPTLGSVLPLVAWEQSGWETELHGQLRDEQLHWECRLHYATLGLSELILASRGRDHGWMPSTCSGPCGLQPKAAVSHRWAGAPSLPCYSGFAAHTVLTRSPLASFSPWGTLHSIQGNTMAKTGLSFGKDLKWTRHKQSFFWVMIIACGMVAKSKFIIVNLCNLHSHCKKL